MLFTIFLILPVIGFSQNRFAIVGYNRHSYGIQMYTKIDPVSCLGDRQTFKLGHDKEFKIFNDTVCRDQNYYMVYTEDDVWYSPKDEFRETAEIDDSLASLKRNFHNSKNRLDSLKRESDILKKIKGEEEKREREREKKEIDSLQKVLDKAFIIYRSKNLVLWEWSWSYAHEYSLAADVSIDVINPFKNKIKYISFTIRAYNAVGDVIKEGITRLTSKTLRGIGPIEYGDHGSYEFETAFYSKVIDKMKIIQITIQFFDGSTKVISNPVTVHKDSD